VAMSITRSVPDKSDTARAAGVSGLAPSVGASLASPPSSGATAPGGPIPAPADLVPLLARFAAAQDAASVIAPSSGDRKAAASANVPALYDPAAQGIDPVLLELDKLIERLNAQGLFACPPAPAASEPPASATPNHLFHKS